MHENNFAEGFELFVVDGADIESRNNQGYTPLLVAVKNDNLELAALLLKQGANVNAQDTQQFAPVHMTSTLEMLNLLVRHGADTSVKNKYGLLPMQSASGSAQVELIRLWLSGGGNVGHRFEYGRTLLFDAHGDEVVKFLLANGADINIKDEAGYTPLDIAVGMSDINQVRALLSYGASLTAGNQCRMISNANLEILRLLIGMGQMSIVGMALALLHYTMLCEGV